MLGLSTMQGGASVMTACTQPKTVAIPRLHFDPKLNPCLICASIEHLMQSCPVLEVAARINLSNWLA